MATRLRPSTLVTLGIALLAVSLAGSFLTQVLLGQQQSEVMANLPVAMYDALAFVFSTAQLLGVALVAVYLGIRAASPSIQRPSAGGDPVAGRIEAPQSN